ncbi:type VI secretion system baseplate subunit TssF [Klebsiella pneumoniae subsp. pneumoniae]|nr:type VI secretion system baseplate subunit TssF [Klebsiella pneumoniae subsp. pneumoniae]
MPVITTWAHAYLLEAGEEVCPRFAITWKQAAILNLSKQSKGARDPFVERLLSLPSYSTGPQHARNSMAICTNWPKACGSSLLATAQLRTHSHSICWS